MRCGVLLAVLACVSASASSATTIGVYYDQASWEAAMTLNGQNPLTSISLDSGLWTSSLVQTTTSTSLVNQSSTAASNGMPLSFVSGYSEPGLQDNSTLGHVSNGVWADSISKYGLTTFNFGTPIYGFGGFFNISDGNGLFIEPIGNVPYPNYAGLATLGSAYPSYSGFIGFISDQPLTSFWISWGDNNSCYECFGNSYTLSDLEVATLPTPEPSYRMFWTGIILFSVCYAISKRS